MVLLVRSMRIWYDSIVLIVRSCSSFRIWSLLMIRFGTKAHHRASLWQSEIAQSSIVQTSMGITMTRQGKEIKCVNGDFLSVL